MVKRNKDGTLFSLLFSDTSAFLKKNLDSKFKKKKAFRLRVCLSKIHFKVILKLSQFILKFNSKITITNSKITITIPPENAR